MKKNKLVAVFESETGLIDALQALETKQVKPTEVYTPYPVHKALSMVRRNSRIPTISWIYGFIGAASVLAFLYWTSVINWPINYGGKPFNSFPSFIIITIVLTILIVTIGSLFTFSVVASLYPGMKSNVIDTRATNDKFVIVFDTSGETSGLGLEDTLKIHGASEVYEN